MIAALPPPSRKELLVFAILWLVFFIAVGRLSTVLPQVLIVAGMVMGCAFLLSFLLEHDQPRSTQLTGAAFPLLFLFLGSAQRLGISPPIVEVLLWIVGVVGCVLVAVSPAAGKEVYRRWTDAAMPIGNTLSYIALAGVYYFVVSPIGILMRILGNDPLSRTMDPEAKSYWVRREDPRGTDKYFRQF